MSKIAVLPPALASQIAAGQMVERPSSALKELMENSFDAGASRVEVWFEGGGIQSLRIIDDGSGMDSEDAQLALERHATSKLRTVEDLHRLVSFGFRGEALPSIASVSKLTLTTRMRESNGGTKLLVEGGGEPQLSLVGCPPGTDIEIRDLFYNVPARRRFLKSTATEAAHLIDVFEAMAAAYPNCTLLLYRDKKLAREYLRCSERASRVEQLLGEAPVIHARSERGPIAFEAFLLGPEQARSGTSGLRILINGRWAKDRTVAHVITQALEDRLAKGKYPRGIVYLDLDPNLVDVNVHPQKLEVRFAEPRAISDVVFGAIANEAHRWPRSKTFSQSLELPLEPPVETTPGTAKRAEPNPAELSAAAEPASSRSAKEPVLLEQRTTQGSRYFEHQFPQANSVPNRSRFEQNFSGNDSSRMPSESSTGSAGASGSDRGKSAGTDLLTGSIPSHPASQRSLTSERSSIGERSASVHFDGTSKAVEDVSDRALLQWESQEGIHFARKSTVLAWFFECQWRRAYEKDACQSQRLMFPRQCELAARFDEVIESAFALLKPLGFELKLELGHCKFLGMPPRWGDLPIEAAFEELLEVVKIQSEQGLEAKFITSALITKLGEQIARVRDEVPLSELRALLLEQSDELASAAIPFVTIAWDEIETRLEGQ